MGRPLRPASQVANKDTVEEDETAVVGTAFGVDPTLEIVLSSQLMSGEELFSRSAAGRWAASPDGDMWTLVDETSGAPTAAAGGDGGGGGGGGGGAILMAQAQAALGAAWPLLAMWPVLFAFYQGELALGMNV